MPQALQDAPGTGSGRIAATWYSDSSFTVDVNVTDGKTHDIELYLLDYDANNRSEQIQLSNAGTGAVLDTENVSNFAGGVYMNWTISGNVLITFTHQTGYNAVVSGLFFDPAAAAATSAPGRPRPLSVRTPRRRATGSDLRLPGLRCHQQRQQQPLLRHRHAGRQFVLHVGGQHDRAAGAPGCSRHGLEPHRRHLVFRTRASRWT